MSEAGAPRRRWTIRGPLLAALIAIAAVTLYAVEPAAAWWLPKCPLHVATGYHCPGCGSTRAVHALLHGDVVEAASMNVLFLATLPLAIGCWWSARRRAPQTLTAWATSLPAVYIWWGLGVILAFGILRNLPIYPFTLLAPH